MTLPETLFGDPSPAQIEILAARAIPVASAVAHGVRFLQPGDVLPAQCPESWAEWLPALLFPWMGPDGRCEWQIRPDVTPVDRDGKPIRYATRSRELGYEPVLWLARTGTGEGPALLVEGTCQTLAAATWAPDGATVAGMIGCRGWSSDGLPLDALSLFADTDVVVALDADMTTNPDVWDAGESLQRALVAEGATVRFLRVPGSRKAGLDDALGRKPEAQRARYLATLIAQAEREKFPKSRRPKTGEGEGNPYFGDGGLQVQELAKAIFDTHPSALTRERKVALYRGGVYGIDGVAFIGAVTELLGNDYRPSHRAAVEEFTVGTLHRTGRVLPDYVTEPLLNVKNGMLDLNTGTLKDHDPVYMSSVQFPIEWDLEARCPTYERWIDLCGITDQIDDLEESVSVMLDPSRTPTKAVLLFGPPRSGKSSFIRLLEAMAGPENRSSVGLAQLNENGHMPANVYGMALNTNSELKAAHIEDISVFKMMTGEDSIQADRKFGAQFSFRNKALFAFSGNELPTVGEASRAYVERIKPFRFSISFAGREDPTIETAMRAELPGILVRWVRAWQRISARGAYLPTAEAIRQEFETRSDRVRQWVAEECVITPARTGAELPDDAVRTREQLTRSFNEWAERIKGGQMGRNKLADRLLGMAGVVEVRRASDRNVGLNLRPRGEGDPWPGESTQTIVLDPGISPVGPVGFKSTVGTREKTKTEEEETLCFSVGAHSGLETHRNPPGICPPRPPMRWDDDGSQALTAALSVTSLPDPVGFGLCPECDGPLTPVPVSAVLDLAYWAACRTCHPRTFPR